MTAIKKIKVPDGRRRVDRGRVLELSKSIAEVGLLNPITVTPDLELIAGAHRLEACILLGHKEIEINIVCAGDDVIYQLAEIDENLIRHELSAAERATLTDRRKTLYLKLHPETAPTKERGGPGRGKQTKNSSSNTTATFAKDTAAKSGRSERSVQFDTKIGAALKESPEVKEIVAGSKVENSQAALLEIARAPKEKRAEVAKEKVAKSKAPKPKRELHPKVAAKERAPEEVKPRRVTLTIERGQDGFELSCKSPVLRVAGSLRDVLCESAAKVLEAHFA